MQWTSYFPMRIPRWFLKGDQWKIFRKYDGFAVQYFVGTTAYFRSSACLWMARLLSKIYERMSLKGLFLFYTTFSNGAKYCHLLYQKIEGTQKALGEEYFLARENSTPNIEDTAIQINLYKLIFRILYLFLPVFRYPVNNFHPQSIIFHL